MNHGHITVGRSVDAAVFRFVLFEQLCASQMRLEATGQPYVVLDDETATATAVADRCRSTRRGSGSRGRTTRSSPASPTCSTDPVAGPTRRMPMDLLGLAYLGLDVPDVDAWTALRRPR